MSRDAPPPLPGGYKLGEKVFYSGTSWTAPNGEKLVHGQQGEVVGPATAESHKGKGVAVLFPGNKGRVDCYLDTVRRLHAASASPPARHRRRPHLPAHAPPPLHRPGAPTPPRQAPPRPPWPHAPSGGSGGGVRGAGVRAGGGVGGRGPSLTCARLWFGRAQVSREPPPPLPGGWKVKDLPYFTGASETLSNGDKVVHGQRGEVVGPATGPKTKGKGVAVLFPGNKGAIECFLYQVRRLHAASASPPACVLGLDLQLSRVRR